MEAKLGSGMKAAEKAPEKGTVWNKNRIVIMIDKTRFPFLEKPFVTKYISPLFC
jgi:hypothetical protein